VTSPMTPEELSALADKTARMEVSKARFYFLVPKRQQLPPVSEARARRGASGAGWLQEWAAGLGAVDAWARTFQAAAPGSHSPPQQPTALTPQRAHARAPNHLRPDAPARALHDALQHPPSARAHASAPELAGLVEHLHLRHHLGLAPHQRVLHARVQLVLHLGAHGARGAIPRPIPLNLGWRGAARPGHTARAGLLCWLHTAPNAVRHAPKPSPRTPASCGRAPSPPPSRWWCPGPAGACTWCARCGRSS
jgi:hypothetical protein